MLLSNIKIDQDIMSEISIGGIAGDYNEAITIENTTNAGNIIISNCTFGNASIWIDPMCYLRNTVANNNINKGHINITNNTCSIYKLSILPQENNYTNSGDINITDNSNNASGEKSTIYATNITNMDVSDFVAPYENPVCNNSGHITITTGENVTIYLAKNIYLDNLSYEDCTNTGTVTVNGEKKEISPVRPEEL